MRANNFHGSISRRAVLRRRLKRRKGIHFWRRFKRLIAAYEGGEIPLDTVSASVQGWVNHVRYGNTVGLRKAVLYRPIGCSGHVTLQG